jgi:hypothetical protein
VELCGVETHSMQKLTKYVCEATTLPGIQEESGREKTFGKQDFG